MMPTRQEAKKLLDRLNELRNQLPRRLSDSKEPHESVEDEPFVKRGVSEFLTKADAIRSNVLRFLDRLGLSDRQTCRDYKQFPVCYWSGPAEGIERPLIIQHFHKWIDKSIEAVEFGLDLDMTSREKTPPRVTNSERTLSRREVERESGAVPSLEKLKEQKSVRQKQAAAILGGISTRMVRKMIEEGKLTKGKAGRILIDAKFELEYQNRHSPASSK
jgi:hypothetical protein